MALLPFPIESVDAIEQNWNFAKNSFDPIHSIHPYPAKFIPEIPRRLILELAPRAEGLIFDPFCGSGTTLLEAQRANFESVGVDLNPIGCLISRVKTTPLPDRFLDIAADVLFEARSGSDFSAPTIPNLDHWFRASAIQAIARLVHQFLLYAGPILDHLRLALSSIIVRVSNQDSDTRYAAIPKEISVEEVYDSFWAACVKLSKTKKHLPSAKTAIVIERDIGMVKTSDLPKAASLVITSPPYPNAFEYWLYHKYRMWWLGFNALEVKSREIGARAHYFRKFPPPEANFELQMTKSMALLRDATEIGGMIALVVGRSRIKGIDVDNAALIESIAAEMNLIPIKRYEREISKSKRSFNLSHARIGTESILIFGKK